MIIINKAEEFQKFLDQKENDKSDKNDKIKEHIKYMKEQKNVTDEKIHMLIYGAPGAGKTIFASTFPDCLYFDFDNGVRKTYINHFKKNTYLKDKSKMMKYLIKAIDQVKKGENKFKTIVIDSLTNLENIAIGEFKDLGVNNWDRGLYKRTKKLEYDDWGSISGSTISFLSNMRELDVNVVVITQIDRITDKGIIKHAPSLIGKGQLESLHFADAVGYMYIEDDNRYIALTASDNDTYYAKSRTLEGKIKDIKNPNFEKVRDKLNSNKFNLNFN